MTAFDTPISVGNWFQGPTGSGQGGWTSHRMSVAIGQPVTIAIRRAIPLETDLVIHQVDDAWHLVEEGVPDQPVLIAHAWDGVTSETAPVTLEAARAARELFPLHDDHPVPVCFSCGLEPDSMRVHSGALGDGRWACDWQVPAWAVDANGAVDEGSLWAAIDCAQAWYAGNDGGRRHAVTVQIAVDVVSPLQPEGQYVLVAWHGTYPREWDGRKRGAGGAVFDRTGTCVARSTSFWLALDG